MSRTISTCHREDLVNPKPLVPSDTTVSIMLRSALKIKIHNTDDKSPLCPSYTEILNV